jgi:hypothetical protein
MAPALLVLLLQAPLRRRSTSERAPLRPSSFIGDYGMELRVSQGRWVVRWCSGLTHRQPGTSLFLKPQPRRATFASREARERWLHDSVESNRGSLKSPLTALRRPDRRQALQRIAFAGSLRTRGRRRPTHPRRQEGSSQTGKPKRTCPSRIRRARALWSQNRVAPTHRSVVCLTRRGGHHLPASHMGRV